jgi:hypothetical protein
MRALKQLRRCTSHGDGAVVGVSVVLTQELDVCHDTRCAAHGTTSSKTEFRHRVE